MKVKLILIEGFSSPAFPMPFSYFDPGAHIDRWRYSPPDCEKVIESVF